ncbi:hypothetical protein E2C01_060545 [Portunus trituberculatus]|uniref:Uncharacterized protein n=1 Tax=Portunus trituberculatus TaxID=210409 RepID=A0A5B7HBQ6_PORTR|nr:hypothetical protein [Portunus trituberculatus]
MRWISVNSTLFRNVRVKLPTPYPQTRGAHSIHGQTRPLYSTRISEKNRREFRMCNLMKELGHGMGSQGLEGKGSTGTFTIEVMK